MANMSRIGTHATCINRESGFTRVVYHSTAVVKFSPSQIILNSGGWQTHTTKTRMNQTANQFNLHFRVFQKNFEWFVEYLKKKSRLSAQAGGFLDEWETIPFVDNMIIPRPELF